MDEPWRPRTVARHPGDNYSPAVSHDGARVAMILNKNGNPDLYVRPLLPPTAAHTTNGLSGTTYERSLTGVATEYGNFVPINGKTETELQPGTWYLGVRAVANANARYRMKLSVGSIQDLPLVGGSLTGQVIAGNDWRYYRVQLPNPAPASWQLTFNQEAGDVVMHLRDTLPPGNGVNNGGTQYRDWTTDAKNTGPYGSFDAAGTYTFGVPPIRPGSVGPGKFSRVFNHPRPGWQRADDNFRRSASSFLGGVYGFLFSARARKSEKRNP